MKHTRIGITGASGQVGSALLRHFHHAGWPTVAAVRNTLGAALCDAAVPGCTIRVGTLTPDATEQHLLDDCDVIINCAIESSGGIPRQAFTRNRRLIDGLLRATSLRWLVHFSTVAVYGELIRQYVDEERERRHPNPGSEYGRSKLDVERYASSRARARGIRSTIIRLGHVYGAGIGRSREIVELARNPAFRLPFDGKLPSNAVHADDIGRALVELLALSEPHGIYSLADPGRTWRHVFDWHTDALGWRPVAGMPADQSERARESRLARSVPGEVKAWISGLPIRSLIRSPATFDVALRILSKTPATLAARAAGVNRRKTARGQIARLATRQSEIPHLYWSAGMPGPFLPIPLPPDIGIGSNARRADELRDWCATWSRPRRPLMTADLEGEAWTPKPA